jgi:hypothetical protein
MPKVDMIATKDFTYMTRRLTAGDPFQARNGLEARILERVRQTAEYPKPPKAKAPEHIPEVGEVLEAEVVEEPAPKPARRRRKAKAKR